MTELGAATHRLDGGGIVGIAELRLQQLLDQAGARAARGRGLGVGAHLVERSQSETCNRPGDLAFADPVAPADLGVVRQSGDGGGWIERDAAGGEALAEDEPFAHIADIVDRYDIPTVKVTGGQRIDMLGVKKDDLPKVWADLSAAGMVSGHAYAKGLRTVKTCVGTDWCRFGTQDSTGLGVKLEKFMWGSWTPAKVKMAVSGCPRNCAEATCKDIGVVCVDSGYDIHFAGAAGLDIKGTELLGHVATEDEAIETIAALAQLYREQGRYLERIYKWAKRVGVDTIRQHVM